MTRHLRGVLLVLLALVPALGPGLHAEIQPDFLMDSDPQFTFPPSKARIDSRLLPLWLEALKRPENELRRLAGDAIAKARSEDFPEMDAAAPALRQALTETETGFEARWTILQALMAIGDRNDAELLLRASQEDPRVRMLVEPKLAEWDYAPAREVWRKRLADPQSPRRELILAIRCLAALRDADSAAGLAQIVGDLERASDVRLAAARAAGEAVASGLEQQAGQLSPHSGAPLVDRLCAVALLASHTSEQAVALLVRFGGDPEPLVAAAALRTLNGIDPAHVLPLADAALQNPDANVRYEGIRCLIALPTPERIETVARQLGDHHPRNRGLVRDELFRLAQQPELDAAVREAGTAALASNGWRELEQASLLLGALDHKPAGPRLVQLLRFDRPEVMGASAWALRKLAIEELLPDMLSHAAQVTAKPIGPYEITDPHLAHLFEAFAILDYQPAEPLLRGYVPMGRGKIGRSAAIWALGHLHKDKPDEALAALMMQRFTDSTSMPPEEALVRQMCAISIGRMKSPVQAPQFVRLIGEKVDHNAYEYSAAWAVRQITGEEIPLADVMSDRRTGWFLEPVSEPESPSGE